jgi:cyclophilin family peptidyl-prolyl cis-trans isomerase
MKPSLFSISICFVLMTVLAGCSMSQSNIVIIETSLGDIDVELDSENAPVTVENFLQYVDDGHFDNTIFHRVIEGFMVQGGGFTADGKQKAGRPPIVLESSNGLKNKRGTLAMARTNDPNSATAQFFINVVDNTFLDFAPGNPGYAVFAKISGGMEVVDKIKSVKTAPRQGMADWPVEDVIIKRIVRKKK